MYIDFLIRLKNAQAAGRKTIRTAFSKLDKAVAEILKEAGFLTKVDIKEKNAKKFLEVVLNNHKPIKGVKFLSRPSLRRYISYREIKPVKGGYGLMVLSTSKGILTGDQAKKMKIGGQQLFKIW